MARKGFFGKLNIRGLEPDYEEDRKPTSQSIRLEWLYTKEEIGRRKGINKAFYKEAGQILQQYMEPYVPRLEGNLASNSQVYSGPDHATVNYKMPYAHAQYTGRGFADEGAVEDGALNEPSIWKRHTPFTTSYWDKAAWYYSRDLIQRDFDNARKRHSHK